MEKRLFRVTELLFAEILPSGEIQWWEFDKIPFDNLECGGMYSWNYHLTRHYGRSFNKYYRTFSYEGREEEDPGFENAVRVIEDNPI